MALTAQNTNSALHQQRKTLTATAAGQKAHVIRCNSSLRRASLWLHSDSHTRLPWRMAHRDLAVLDAAERVADMVNELIHKAPRGRLLHVRQLRDAVQSIGANISEGFGRGTVRDRDHRLEIARGETEEAIRHLGANYRANRIASKDYWRIHNRLLVIAKMLTRMLRH